MTTSVDQQVDHPMFNRPARLATFICALLVLLALPGSSRASEITFANRLIRSAAYEYGYAYAPSIVYDGTFHMLYCSSPAGPGELDSIRSSTSSNGLTWTTPKVILRVSGGSEEGSACDPSVVKYQAPGDSQPYYYLFYSGNAGASTGTLMFVARSTSLEGPFAKWTKSYTWEVNASNPQPIITAEHPKAETYGAGEQTVIATPTGLKAWWGDSTVPTQDILFATTKDPTTWPVPTDTGVSYSGPEGDSVSSADVKYNPLTGRYEMFYINLNGGASSSLRVRASRDGIKWGAPTVLCSTGSSCMQAYAGNPGISGDASGDLIQGRGLIAYGAAGEDCQPGELSCTYHLDLFGSILNPTASGSVYSSLPLVEAKTFEASKVSIHQAVLHGTVNPNGVDTKYHFEWGTQKEFEEEKYTNSAPVLDKDIGSGTNSTSLEQEISGLAGESTYHYRIVATNSRGTSYGEDVSFTTPADTPGHLSAMNVAEPFNGNSGSLSNFNSLWSSAGWAEGAAPKGEDVTSGWRPADPYPTVDGAYYGRSVVDFGKGIGAVVTMAAGPSVVGGSFSLWLDSPSSTAKREGYELRFTDVSTNVYEVRLAKWVKGSETVLATKASFSFANGDSLALTDEGSSVGVWTDAGGGFSQLLSAGDSAFSGAFAGISGKGSATRLTNFRVGELLPPGNCCQNLGGTVASDPDVASMYSNHLDLFVRGTDGALWHKYWAGTAWSNWESLGGSIKAGSGPSAVSWANGRIDVFARAPDDSITHWWYEGIWNCCQNLGGTVASDPDVASMYSNHLDLFVRGTDGALWHKYWAGTAWSNWESLGGSIKAGSGPSAVSWANGRIDVFARAPDDSVNHWWYDGTWHCCQNLEAAITSSPDVASPNPGQLDLFARGSDGALWHMYYYENAWSNWESLGGSMKAESGPGAVSWGPGRIDVFGRAPNDSIEHWWYG